MVAFIALTLFVAAFFPTDVECQSTLPQIPRRGTIRLVRNGVTNPTYSSGRVQIYLNSWGHICDDLDFGFTEAIVVCHQMGYTSASSYTRRSLDMFGLDSGFLYALDNVDCSTSSYLVILQCRHSTFISSGCRVNADEVSVMCLSTRIWSSPFDSQIRLRGAQYTNQGLVEIYCNGQWGTICDNVFDSRDANTICRQQGYTRAARYDSLSLTGSSSQPIWYASGPCLSSQSCFRTCRQCPSSRATSCSHSEDITVECEFSSGGFSSTQLGTCNIVTVNVAGIVVGVIIASIVCTLLPILIPVCICCCLGIGICGASRRSGPSTRVVTTAVPPPATTASVITTTETTQKMDYPTGAYPTQQPTPYPAQPPPPAYAAQPPAAYPAQPPAGYAPAGYPAQPPAGYY